MTDSNNSKRVAKSAAFIAVDDAMFHTDSPRFPQNVHVEVRAPRRLDAARMRAAVYQALQTHPLSRARSAAHGSSDRDLAWEITDEPGRDPFVVVDAGDDLAAERRRSQLLNLQAPLQDSPPLYVWLVRRTKGDSLIFNVNHAVADGVGSLRFLRSVVNAYAGVSDGRAKVDPIVVREAPIYAPGKMSNSSAKGKRQRSLKNYIDDMRRSMSKPSSIASGRRSQGASSNTIEPDTNPPPCR